MSMQIGELKQRLKGICEEQAVVRLDLFGSRARTQGMQGNDYDFIADFGEASPAEYSRHYFGLLHALEDELDSPVDLMTYPSLKKYSLRRSIERERVPVYER